MTWNEITFGSTQSISEYYADMVKDHKWDKDPIDDKEQINNAVKASMIKSSLTDADTRRFHKTSKDVFVTGDYNEISIFLNNNNWDLKHCNNQCHIISSGETMKSLAKKYGSQSTAEFKQAIQKIPGNKQILAKHDQNGWFQVGDQITLPTNIKSNPSSKPTPPSSNTKKPKPATPAAPKQKTPTTQQPSSLTPQSVNSESGLLNSELDLLQKYGIQIGNGSTGWKPILKHDNLTGNSLKIRIMSSKALDSQLKVLSKISDKINFLDLEKLGLTEMPDLTEFKKLQAVDLDSNEELASKFDATKLPENLSNLFIKRIGLTGMPDLTNLRSLKHLELKDNKGLKNNFDAMKLPTTIEYLDLQNTTLTEMPDLTKLNNLQTLGLSNNKGLKDNFDAAKLPENLNNLFIEGIGLTEMPDLKELTQLSYLDLEGTSIKPIKNIKDQLPYNKEVTVTFPDGKIEDITNNSQPPSSFWDWWPF